MAPAHEEHCVPLNDTDNSFYGVSTPPPLAPSLSTSSSAPPGSGGSSTVSFEMKRESGDDVERGRCDSSLTGGDARLSICSTSGTVYESVVVVGHIYGSDNVVYYLLEVKSSEMPLEGYVIRRRYNDFKHLHRQLALCMPLTGAVRRGSSTVTAQHRGPFGISTSSLLCTSLSSTRPETSPLWSPRRRPATHTRRNSITGMRLHGLDESGEPRTPEDPHQDYDTRFSAPSLPVPPRLQASVVALPFHDVSFTREDRPVLPPLPPGGVASLFSTREMLIKSRIEQFNRLLAAVLSDTSPRVAQLLQTFIQDKPSAPQTYVSLNQYAPVEMSWNVERLARRRVTMSGKRDKALLASAG